MGQKIGIVSQRLPTNATVGSLSKKEDDLFWFAEVQAAFAHMLSSRLDILYLDEDAERTEHFLINNYIKKSQLLNRELKVSFVKLPWKEMDLAAPHLAKYVAPLESMLKNGEIKIYFQPIIIPKGEQKNLYGLECLSRLNYNGSCYGPDFIFNYAQEKFSLIDYDKRCLEMAMRSAPHNGEMQIFLNVRSQTLACEDFIPWLKDLIAINHIDQKFLAIEITEQHCMFNEAIFVGQCTLLRDMGIKLAMDDFGLGISNLSMFEAIKPHIIKVAGRFIKQVQGCGTKQKIVKNIIELARDFSIDAVVENVETKEEWHMVNSLGARYAQGYYFYKPLTKEATVALLRGDG